MGKKTEMLSKEVDSVIKNITSPEGKVKTLKLLEKASLLFFLKFFIFIAATCFALN
jgi:hypothetical protein